MTSPGPGVVVGFGLVFGAEASECAKRAHAAEALGDPNRVAGAVAAGVLMSCAAIEASLSELATCLAVPSPHYRTLPQDLLVEVRDGNSPLYSRFEKLIEFYSPGQTCGTHEPFKNLRCLVELRNHLAHRHAAFLTPGQWPDDLKQCKKRIPAEPGAHLDWTSALLIPAVADWAARTMGALFEWATPLLPVVRAGPPSGAAV